MVMSCVADCFSRELVRLRKLKARLQSVLERRSLTASMLEADNDWLEALI